MVTAIKREWKIKKFKRTVRELTADVLVALAVVFALWFATTLISGSLHAMLNS